MAWQIHFLWRSSQYWFVCSFKIGYIKWQKLIRNRGLQLANHNTSWLVVWTVLALVEGLGMFWKNIRNSEVRIHDNDKVEEADAEQNVFLLDERIQRPNDE
jgi:hypothetical protein